jgi:hypothetical protein
MDFSDALSTLRQGGRVRRKMWSGLWNSDVWLEIVPETREPDRGRVLTEQLMIVHPDGVMRPFAGANWDLLADDWEAG